MSFGSSGDPRTQGAHPWAQGVPMGPEGCWVQVEGCEPRSRVDFEVRNDSISVSRMSSFLTKEFDFEFHGGYTFAW